MMDEQFLHRLEVILAIGAGILTALAAFAKLTWSLVTNMFERQHARRENRKIVKLRLDKLERDQTEMSQDLRDFVSKFDDAHMRQSDKMDKVLLMLAGQQARGE